MLTLRIDIVDCSVTKTINFKPSTLVYDACEVIREKVPDALAPLENDVKKYGLFYTEEDKRMGIWLEPGKSLEYYVLRNGDILEYKKKIRTLKIRMLDDSVKTMMVDDSHTVSQIMITVCTKIGITNHEEYSLVRDLPDSEKEKTMTMKRDKSIARNQKKMDEMMKKLHTDDELDWLDHNRSLREQGVDEKATLLLRRKYFFSDQNIDARDPIQLHLLYVQTRDNIMKGALPVSQERALEFAGLQCQIQYGDYNESKHKPGFLELKEVLPKEYCRVKKIEKEIYVEHNKQKGADELEAKTRYTQLARSLPTYGIAFFLVKEKVKGKNKLSPTLLGISKESVVKIDNDKKEIVKSWPLTTVKRWAPSPNTFTLDFGDYADSYYCVQTLEGEQIAQLISGYIDIILKKKQAKDYLGTEGDEESTMYEDSVCPAKATIMQHQSVMRGQATMGNVALPAVLRSGDTDNSASHHHMQQPHLSNISQLSHIGHRLPSGQKAGMVGLGGAQRALMGRIGEGMQAFEEAQQQLNYKADLPHLGNDPGSKKWREEASDNHRQRLSAQLSSLNTATAQIVLLTATQPEDGADYTALGTAVQTIGSSMGRFTGDVRMLAALEDQGILGAAQSLVAAFSDLLQAAQSGAAEPRQKILNAANRVGEAGDGVRRHLEEDTLQEAHYKDKLMTSARQVASCASDLVRQAKNVSAACGNKQDQNAVVEAATKCALSSSQLVACSRVLAATIDHPQCQEQLVEAAKSVANSVNDVVGVSQQVCSDESVVGPLNESALAVSQALEALMRMVKAGVNQNEGLEQVDSIMMTTDRLVNSFDDTHEIVKQTRTLAQATSSLVTSLKNEAEQQADSEQQNKLLSAAKLLADATARMVEAAKGCASQPNDEDSKEALRTAADHLRSVANEAATGALKQPLLHNLQKATKKATTAATQLIYAAETAGKCNSSQQSQQQLNSLCNNVADDVIPRLNQALRLSHKQAHQADALHNLITAAKSFIQPCNRLLTTTKAAQPTITDQSSALLLNNHHKNLSAALLELRSALERSLKASTVQCPIQDSLLKISNIENELEETKKSAKLGQLIPLPGDTLAGSSHQLGAASKAVATAMAQLLTAATQGSVEHTGGSSRQVAECVKTFSDSVRGVAATSDEVEERLKVLEHGIDVVHKSGRLVQEANMVLQNPQQVEAKNRLAMATKVVSQSLTSCIACLPGVKQVDEACKKVNEASKKVNMISQSGHSNMGNGSIYKGTECSLQEVQLKLNNTAGDLNQVTEELLQACGDADVKAVTQASDKLAKTYEELLDDAVDMATHTKDSHNKSNIVSRLHAVTHSTNNFLTASKTLLSEPEASSSRDALTNAARQVSESINDLINVCTVASPAIKHADNAIRNIQSMKMVLNNPPSIDASYPECLHNVIVQSKDLAGCIPRLNTTAKEKDPNSFITCLNTFHHSISSILQHTAHAAHLVGVSDEQSQPGTPALLHHTTFTTASHHITAACHVLATPATNNHQMLAAVSTIANQTSLLCNACRQASARTDNALSKNQLVQSAKNLANHTALMVKAMKASTEDGGDNKRPMHVTGEEAGKPLLECLQTLLTLAQSPQFAATPATISPQGRKSQEPLQTAGHLIIDHSVAMLTASKSLTSHPSTAHAQYSQHSHGLSEALKALLSSLRSLQPGVKECDASLQEISLLLHDIDNLSLTSDQPDHSSYAQSGSIEACHDKAINSAKQLRSLVEPLQMAAKGDNGNFGHLVKSATSYLTPFKSSLLGCVRRTKNSRVQTELLAQSKTVAECLHNLLLLAKQSANDANPTKDHSELDESASECQESLDTILASLTTNACNNGVVTSLLDNINRSIALASEESTYKAEDLSFAEHQTNIVNILKIIAKNAQEMNIRAASKSVEEMGQLANNITQQYASLVQEGAKASVSCSSPQMGSRIKSCIKQLGLHCSGLVQYAGAIRCDSNDPFAKKELDQHVKKIIESATDTMTLLQSSARGTQACITACNSIKGIIADLDTSIMFASAATLTNHPGDSFANYREGILTTAKDLVEDTKQLVAGAAMKQDQLAGAATKATTTINLLSDRIKKAAASLGADQNEAQVLLMNAAKDVATALNDLIGVTKMAAGKPPSHPVMESLKEAAKVMVTNVTCLLKTVKTVEDEALMASMALESAIEAVCQEMKAYSSIDRVEKEVSPDHIIRITRPVAMATAKAVAAGNSGRQEDVVAAANLGRKAVSDLLRHCKGGVLNVEDDQLKQRMLHTGLNCGKSFRELLLVLQQRNESSDAELKQNLASASKRVAMAVTDVVQAAEAIKGMDWADPEDPTVIAEAELLSAANSIEAAANKLSTLQPKLKPKQADETLNFEEQLLEAAKCITTATSALVRAASLAQKELMMQGKIGVSTEELDSDNQWSQGLISAAKLVALATHSLGDAANAMVQGHASEERLISAAKQVASSTAQLLIACKVKASANSQAMKRLQTAGHAVKKATEALVREAQKMKEVGEEEGVEVSVNHKMVTDMAQIIMAQEEILRKEKELQNARRKLETIRKAKYKHEDDDD